MALQKARIAKQKNINDYVEVMFNPEEYTVNRENNIAQIAIPGLRAPLLQFVHGNMQTMEMELLLDTVEEHRTINQAGADVRPLVKKFTALLDIDPETHAPPILVFVWASLLFTCVLGKVTQRFTMFRADGAPVRAKLQVTFNEFTNAETEAKEIKRETVDYSRVHTVSTGDTIDALAFQLLGAPHLWRPIAIVNALANPRELQVGQRLLIPRLPFRDPDTGEVYDA